MKISAVLTYTIFRTTIILIRPSNAQDGDWISNWSTDDERILDGAFEVDPLDSRTMMRGSGTITFGNGIAKFTKSPRLYISHGDDVEGWEQVEFIAYGKLIDKGVEPYKSYAGLTLVARSNHDNYYDQPCDAFGVSLNIIYIIFYVC